MSSGLTGGVAAASPREPDTAGPHPRAHPNYWQAQAFADTLLAEFEAARRAGKLEELRARFYVLAAYYRRTLAILHSGLEHRRESLVEATLRNLIVLQRALNTMRQMAPDSAQSTLALESEVHDRVNRDLVHRILKDARGPLSLATITRRFNELDLIADARGVAIDDALQALVETGHAAEHEGKYTVTDRSYVDTNVDRAEMLVLLGPALGRRLAGAGFEGLSQVVARAADFRRLFEAETGFGAATATMALAAAAALMRPAEALHAGGVWPHANLNGSAHPRPYQRLLHAVLRAHGYAAQAIEAPAGSGKTFVGMMCMEDWLRTMAPGQSILVLVPTVNYQRQWLSELCLKQAGLRLAPDLVFAGTPKGLARSAAAGLTAVLVLTYAALAQSASPVGKGGFDRAAIERFLQGNNVRHIILDEVHKVAAELSGASAAVVRVFREWLRDGSLSSLIGFSGTLVSFRPQLRSLGLDLAYVLPAAELIGQGWVAPFAEFGAPFSYSEREREISALIDEYRNLLRAYLRRIGAPAMRRWFSALSPTLRERIAARLGMYAGRRERDALIRQRLGHWETGGGVSLSEALLVAIVQAANGWPDRAMLAEAGWGAEAERWTEAFEGLRSRLRPLLPPGRLRDLLSVEGLGECLEAAALTAEEVGRRMPPVAAREMLATTFTGIYLALRGWSRQAGEGRVAAVSSIIAAERRARRVTGVIVFDNPAPLAISDGTATPGYRGAGGMFVQMLGDRSCVPMAALTSALYLPDGTSPPVHERIADWVVRRIIAQEQGEALFTLLVTGAELGERQAAQVRPWFEKFFSLYVTELTERGATRLLDFDRLLLRPLRDTIRGAQGHNLDSHALNWLRLDHHLRSWATSIAGYAAIAAAFRNARLVQAVRGDGGVSSLRLIPVPGGQRRQLLLDLTARIVDSDEIPVDVVIVSNWARTGWNVLTPNVLIDATATREATAWQQLRGRAMRPARSWSSVAQRLVQHLVGGAMASDGQAPNPLSLLSPDELRLAEAAMRATRRPNGPEFAEDLAVSVMLKMNKVTHVYELIRAHGTRAQVEYSRARHRWERGASIASKHRREGAVRASDGAYVSGPAHAPLLVAVDPRRDLPGAFEACLSAELASADERIVRGWLRAAPGPASASEDADAGYDEL